MGSRCSRPAAMSHGGSWASIDIAMPTTSPARPWQDGDVGGERRARRARRRGRSAAPLPPSRRSSARPVGERSGESIGDVTGRRAARRSPIGRAQSMIPATAANESCQAGIRPGPRIDEQGDDGGEQERIGPFARPPREGGQDCRRAHHPGAFDPWAGPCDRHVDRDQEQRQRQSHPRAEAPKSAKTTPPSNARSITFWPLTASRWARPARAKASRMKMAGSTASS